MANSANALRTLFALTLLTALSYLCFVSAATKPPSPYNRLCQQRELTTEPRWRKCAQLTIDEWSRAVVDVGSSNLTAAMDLYAGIISPNIVLRLEPMGTFAGLEMVTEYLTIFASPTGPAQIIKPLSYTIRRYTASRPIAVATIDFLFMNVFTGTTANLTVEQWFRFDNYNRVAAADFTTDRYVEFTPALGVQAVFAANPNISASLLGGVCQAAATYCRTPSLQQYADVPTCLGFLSSVPFINPLRTQANSVMCRFLHSSLVRFAPEIHCPHIGPSGGGVCVDEPYSAFYTASPFPAGTFALM